MRITLTSFIIVCASAIGQTRTTGSAFANGACNIAISGNGNTVSTAALKGGCAGGIGKEQGQKIIQLLNVVLAKKETAQINSKLDELIEVAAKPSQVMNCFGSNCVQNGTQQNFDNRQFGAPQPPPLIQGVTTMEAMEKPRPGASPLLLNPGLEVKFTIDRVFSNPMFMVRCDRPCFATDISTSADGLFTPHSYTTNDPKVAVAGLGGITTLLPNTSITVKLHSADQEKISIVDVQAYIPPIEKN